MTSRTTSPNLIRWGAIGAAIAGVAWALSGVVAFVFAGEYGNTDPTGTLYFYLYEGVHAIAWVGMLLALLGYHVRQTPTYGRLGTAGFMVAFGGTALMLLVTVWWLIIADEAPILDILWSVVLLGWIVGFVSLGVATSRAKVLPRWCGLLLIAYIPLGFFAGGFNGVGGLLVGLLWLTLGYVLLRWGDAPAGQSSVVMPTAREDVKL